MLIFYVPPRLDKDMAEAKASQGRQGTPNAQDEKDAQERKEVRDRIARGLLSLHVWTASCDVFVERK